MAQLALDKTADAFRNLHMERLSATNKWQETLNLIAVRENELQEAFEKVSTKDQHTGPEAVFFVSTRQNPRFSKWERG